ncbi:Crustacyanin-C1 subunit [Penaeus vannamei]|uniref:Crustacyanin-C1 subunit n=1 Tax=Penaeus vannamei TaxID=6689 RepID=A0A3R7PEL0_PENVA|nr:Crustacyanin-C1 subunit [Penaeus vannamei]
MLASDGSKFIAKSTGINADGNLMRHNGQGSSHASWRPSSLHRLRRIFYRSLCHPRHGLRELLVHLLLRRIQLRILRRLRLHLLPLAKLSDQYLRRCEAAFKEIGVDVSRFAKTVQGSNCPYDTQKSL